MRIAVVAVGGGAALLAWWSLRPKKLPEGFARARPLSSARSARPDRGDGHRRRRQDGGPDRTMLAVVLTGAALLRERERGTIEHLLVMPVTPFEIMSSKVWSMGLVVLVAFAVSLAVVVRGWLSVPLQGSVPLTHIVRLTQGTLCRGAGLDAAWPQFLALAVIGAVFFGVALARFRKTIGTMA